MAVPAELTPVLIKSFTSPAARSLLTRPYKALLFDWDGTAVVNRQEDASALARLAESLLDEGVWLLIVTGTNFPNVDRQFCAHVAPPLRRRIVACVNRGSEIYRFDDEGASYLAWGRVATPAEEHALDATAEAVRDAIHARSGLEIGIVFNRLNRRKIDLIPTPDWADPPKERIGELLVAVEERLQFGGFPGGMREAIGLAEKFAAEFGIADPRITSDVKHIEVGLTDKSDSVRWVRDELLAKEQIDVGDVLVLGDEFGPVAGFDGSDDKLRTGMAGATVVSVGKEPNGAPDGVLHLDGGPARFRVLLGAQAALHREQWEQAEAAQGAVWPLRDQLDILFDIPTEPLWQLDAQGYDPALERDVESLFTVGNGFLGIRGSLDDITSASQPRTFVAGLFNTLQDDVCVPDIVSAPDWMRLRLFRDDDPIPLTGDGDGQEQARRVLDMRRGVLHGECAFEDDRGRITVRTLRFASLASRRVAVQIGRIEATRPCMLSLEAWTDAPGEDLVVERQTPSLGAYRTTDGARRLALANHTALRLGGRELPPTTELVTGHRSWTWQAAPGRPATFVRLVALSRDTMDERPEEAARAALAEIRGQSLTCLRDEHVRAWDALWAAASVEIEGDEDAQRALRFALYHLLSAANPEDDRVSVGARALTGEGYKGHVFWDTDIYLLPFYCHTWPEAARAMLRYRHHTLPAARAKARRLGFEGALYAWESADTGEETCPTQLTIPNGEIIKVRCGIEEHHISADVAYAVWQYWRVTGDDDFFLTAGAEVLLETARFWASRPALEADGKYHVRNVIGPDEYHEGVDDDAYTNAMAAWNLERGIEVAGLLAVHWPERWAELRDELALSDEELAHWRTVSAGLVIRRGDNGTLLEQFEGFFHKEYIDLSGYAPAHGTMEVLYGQKRLNGSQVIKQADVVMLTALVPEAFSPEAVAENFRYYEPRTAHGSSLSPAMHALVAARLGDVEMARSYFHRAAAIDLDNAMRNASHGVHIATAGGLWMASVQGFGGVDAQGDTLRLDPHLPAAWQALRFPLQWHGRHVRCDIEQSPRRVSVSLEAGDTLPVAVGDLRATVASGQTWVCAWDEAAGCWREEHENGGDQG